MQAVMDYTLQQYNGIPQTALYQGAPSDQCDFLGNLIKSIGLVHNATVQSPIATFNKVKFFEKPQESATDIALSRLRSFKSWSDNWDGEGATAPDHELLSFSMDVLSLLANYRKSFVAHLNADSQPVFYLRNSKWTGELTAESIGIISFHFSNDNEIIEDFDVRINNNSLPANLQYALSAF